MRFRMIELEGNRALAFRDGPRWRALSVNDGKAGAGDLDAVVRSADFGRAAAQFKNAPEIDISASRTLLPFVRAGKVLCVGLNYLDHASESKMEVPRFPTVFVRFNANLVPDGGKLILPKASDMFDYEGELVAVIGKPGRAIPEDQALDHVAGYTVFNDGSIRDFQLRTSQWTIGKNFDSTGALGPDFVTSDELPDGAAGLRLQTRLNGKVLQDASTGSLIFSVASLVSQISVAMTLEPGDLICTGTPSGVGFARDPKVMMKAGDVCEVEIEGLGLLRNAVVAEA